ncbi:MAG: hypothetical protein WAK80_02560, partial [Candidatus Cybelea sp.]
MMRDPLEIWLRDVVARAGFSGAGEFAAHFDLKPYRLRQLYRAANKELLAAPNEVTTLPKELRAALTDRNVRFSVIEPVVLQRSNDRQTTKGLFR